MERASGVTRRVAIVTGSGRGIGRSIALALAREGIDLVVVGRTLTALQQVVRDAQDLGVEAVAMQADVTDEANINAVVTATVERFGALDVLVNNSGVLAEGSFLDISQAEFDRVVATNLRGTAICCRAVGARLVAQGSGKIINIASVLGLGAEPGLSSYCASKAAVINLTRALALEWAAYNVQVNAIAPGWIETDMNAGLREDPQRLKAVVRRIPARRFGLPEDVAGLAVFLAGASSDFMTGEVVLVDGGQMARV
jgi:2-deoxy-D-gluconate 3-dehydrogenase